MNCIGIDFGTSSIQVNGWDSVMDTFHSIPLDIENPFNSHILMSYFTLDEIQEKSIIGYQAYQNQWHLAHHSNILSHILKYCEKIDPKDWQFHSLESFPLMDQSVLSDTCLDSSCSSVRFPFISKDHMKFWTLEQIFMEIFHWIHEKIVRYCQEHSIFHTIDRTSTFNLVLTCASTQYSEKIYQFFQHITVQTKFHLLTMIPTCLLNAFWYVSNWNSTIHQLHLHEKSLSIKDSSQKEYLLSIDWGSSTFSISLLSIPSSTLKEIQNSSFLSFSSMLIHSKLTKSKIGGNDIDHLLINYFIQEFYQQHHQYIGNDIHAYKLLARACERAKRLLTDGTRIALNVDSLYQGICFRSYLTRKKFNQLIQPILNQTFFTIQNFLYENQLSFSSISLVLMYGGSTKIHSFHQQLEKMFPTVDLIQLSSSFGAESASSFGKCLQAHLYQWNYRKSFKGNRIGLKDRHGNFVPMWTKYWNQLISDTKWIELKFHWNCFSFSSSKLNLSIYEEILDENCSIVWIGDIPLHSFFQHPTSKYSSPASPTSSVSSSSFTESISPTRSTSSIASTSTSTSISPCSLTSFEYTIKKVQLGIQQSPTHHLRIYLLTSNQEQIDMISTNSLPLTQISKRSKWKNLSSLEWQFVDSKELS